MLPAARMVDEDERWLLAEMLREAERVVDRLFRMAEEQDDKTEQTIAFGVAALGGGLALMTFAAGQRILDVPGFVLLLGGGITNLLALQRFLGAYLGLPRASGLFVGPDPSWLADAADALPDAVAHLHLVLRLHATTAPENLAALRRVAAQRRTGLGILLLALVQYAFGAFYIVGRTVAA